MVVYSTVSVTSLWRCRTTPSSTTKTIWWLYTTEYQRPEVLRLSELRMSCMLKTSFMCFTSTSQGINVWCPSWTRYCKHVRLLPASEFVNFDLKLSKKYEFFKNVARNICIFACILLLICWRLVQIIDRGQILSSENHVLEQYVIFSLCCFLAAAPAICNSLQDSVYLSDTLFLWHLKTHLFQATFSTP